MTSLAPDPGAHHRRHQLGVTPCAETGVIPLHDDPLPPTAAALLPVTRRRDLHSAEEDRP